MARPAKALLLALAASLLAAWAGVAPAAGPGAAEKKGLETQQRELRRQIGKLSEDITERRKKKKAEEEAAKSAATALSASNRKLERLDTQRRRNDGELAYIRTQTDKLDSRIDDARRDRAVTARARYLFANKPPWGGVLAAGATPSEINRAAACLAYLEAGHIERAGMLEERRGMLESRGRVVEQKNRNISDSAATEMESNKRLAAERERHKANSAELEKQIATRERRIAELKRDQKRLASLVERINRQIAAAEKAERERTAAEAKKRKDAAKGTPRGSASTPAPVAADTTSRFSRLRGKLPMPVKGTIAGRFGRSRNGAGSWQGLFIKAPVGSRVSAVAAGKVVYADYLRGYGNLLIIDHGEGYLSVYAHNDSLSKVQGDKVASEEAVARSGTGASGDTPGLYFELRFKGRPIDPAGWVRG